MTIAPPVLEEELHAFADGRLGPVRRAEVEAWLAEHPEDAERIAAWRRIDSDLHRRFDPVMEEAVPAALTVPPPRSPVWRALARAVAAVLLLTVGAAGGWLARDLAPAPERTPRAGPDVALVSQATSAHAVYTVEVRHPVEVGADEEEHLVNWLSRRMGRKIKAPRLEAAGYRLMGGRLLPGGDGVLACQFMYENAAGGRVTVFAKQVAEGAGETAFRFATSPGGVSAFYWLDDKLGYAISGGLAREELLRLARMVYEQLTP